jgi:hypothetical protein
MHAATSNRYLEGVRVMSSMACVS